MENPFVYIPIKLCNMSHAGKEKEKDAALNSVHHNSVCNRKLPPVPRMMANTSIKSLQSKDDVNSVKQSRVVFPTPSKSSNHIKQKANDRPRDFTLPLPEPRNEAPAPGFTLLMLDPPRDQPKSNGIPIISSNDESKEHSTLDDIPTEMNKCYNSLDHEIATEDPPSQAGFLPTPENENFISRVPNYLNEQCEVSNQNMLHEYNLELIETPV